MLFLILGLLIVGLIIFTKLSAKTGPHRYDEYGAHELYVVLAWIFGVCTVGIIVAICCLFPKVATANIIDSKIAMYQEENSIIEQDIDRIVDAYLKHEQDTYTDLKTEESSITLVTLFPELKSDTLVKQQLEIYIANNARIKSLKTEKIDIAKWKWILYFGK